ncbi:winged helix DNA-binding domain-containing protein [Amycolatopsis sp.]|uniref:winged helix DNA-binding domain-containing protein n=1 Tax=Amycolatopsis sp. TaxID=37632 RepID=UPI002C0F63AF|nr:winged helix DNA-binding domain-containing protein [Amycolatopsis sp.]HVV11414.1 winged helix DNA-binding domain-containing protein [Amycolatopsis sp.]
MEVLGTRALNRALLARQFLLQRVKMSPLEAVHHLVGMQAQAPFPPYFGLWSRLHGFAPDDLARLIEDRSVVRIALMRGTVHLVTASDALWLRPLVQPLFDRDLRTNTTHAAALRDLDLEELAANAKAVLAEHACTGAELGKALAAWWPDRAPAALAHAARGRLPLVQLPPRAVWGRSGQTIYATAEEWLGRSLATEASLEDLVRRYLAAFGPATVNDIQAWSGLARMGEVVDRVRDELAVFATEEGRELFDLPKAPRPDPDTSAPPRFLAEFDNLLLSHADRTRVMSEESRKRVFGVRNGIFPGTVLVNGFVRGTWKLAKARRSTTLVVEAFERLSRKDTSALESSGNRLLQFAAPDTTHEISFT